MPRQLPVAEEVDAAFYSAANENRLVIQYCASCDRWQFPPEPACTECGSVGSLSWREVEGRGTIYSYSVIHDTQIASMRQDVPYNAVIIALDECPGVLMVSQLPLSRPGEVPIGNAVQLVFVSITVAGQPSQRVPEWELIP